MASDDAYLTRVALEFHLCPSIGKARMTPDPAKVEMAEEGRL